MIRTEEVQRVCCDWCGRRMKGLPREMTSELRQAIHLSAGAFMDPSKGGQHFCARCIRRLCALAEQIRTQPRRKTKAWSESVPQGLNAEKVKT